MISLDRLLAYEHPLVIERFSRRYPEKAAQSKVLFHDMLCYLWLCEKHHALCTMPDKDSALDFTPVMHTEMFYIDEMWHDFILMTNDYADFCQKYFGHFIHHQVNMRQQSPNEEQMLKETELFLSFIYDHLGSATLSRWFNAS